MNAHSRGSVRFGALALGLVLATSAGAGDDAIRYRLGFDAPRFIVGDVGEEVAETIWATLAGDGVGEGASAWSHGFVFTARGSELVGVGLEGTAAEAALDGGFVMNEIVEWRGGPAVVSTVTLPEGQQLALDAEHRILAIDISSQIGSSNRFISLSHFEGVEGSEGAVPLHVRDGDRDVVPSRGFASLRVVSSDWCRLHGLGFSLHPVVSEVPFDRIVGGASLRGETEILVGEGPEAGRFHVFPSIVSRSVESNIVQGWSLSVEIEGDAVCVDATIEGTAGELLGGFSKTECVDPELNGGRRGVVSAVIPPHFDVGVIEARGTYSVLDLTVAGDGPQGSATRHARLVFRDELQGSGQPVSSVLTVAGDTYVPCDLEVAELSIRFAPDGIREFIRGDANFDGQVDVSDPVTLLRFQFRGDAIVRCHDAGDANDDGTLDVADAIFAFGYLFLGTAPPATPFPDAGLDPTPDELRCEPEGVTTR